MEEETILEEIFFDREQRILAELNDEERKVLAEIKEEGNEEKLRELIKEVKDERLRGKIDNLLEYTLEDVTKRCSVSLEKYYKQGFKDGVNLIVECVG